MTKAVFYISTLALAGSFAGAVVHKVQVAPNGNLAFDPDTIRAQPGDEIAFFFDRGTHDVTLGEFNRPCQPGNDAFWSGTINIPSGARANATFTIPVQNGDTKWVYCSVARHCQRGMVAVINPGSGQNIGSFKSAAANAPDSNRPTAINGGSLNIGGDLDIPGFPGMSMSMGSSSRPTGTSSAASSTGSATRSSDSSATSGASSTATRTSTSATGTPSATGNAAASVQGNGILSAAVAGLAVGAAWFGLL